MKKVAEINNTIAENTENRSNYNARRHVSGSPRYRPAALAPLPHFQPSNWGRIDPDEPSDEEWNEAAHRLMSDVLAEEFDEPAPGYGHADLHREWTMARHCRLDEDTDY